MGWIEAWHEKLPLTRQCELARVTRATVYRRIDAASRQACEDESDMQLCALIDEEYISRPFYGSRRMVVFLRAAGYVVNRKRVRRLMCDMGLAGMAPGQTTSRAHPRHKVYPYLLHGMPLTRPSHVWSTDITYTRLAGGFAYLAPTFYGHRRLHSLRKIL